MYIVYICLLQKTIHLPHILQFKTAFVYLISFTLYVIAGFDKPKNIRYHFVTLARRQDATFSTLPIDD